MGVIGIAELFLIMVAVAGSGAMVAFLAWLVFRVKRLEAGGTKPIAELRDLTHRIDALREEVEHVNGDVARLSERMDFTERLLSDGSPADTGAESQGRTAR